MSERAQSYVGVTGPVTTEEVHHLVTTYKDSGIDETSHQPMIGFLVSFQTLHGLEVPNRRYPQLTTLPSLLKVTEGYPFNTIHYNSKYPTELADQIKAIFRGQIYDDELCRGLQLNIPWPPIDQLIEAKRLFPDLKTIIQLSHRSLNGKSPQDVARLLARYGALADYTLIDPSGGRGKGFQPQEVVPYYLAIRDQIPDIAIGLAGGFTGDYVVERCRALIDLIGTDEFSIDAEGGLRDPVTDAYGDDLYNPSKVESYIREAAKVFLKTSA